MVSCTPEVGQSLSIFAIRSILGLAKERLTFFCFLAFFFSTADNGTAVMWDYKSGLPFQNFETPVHPGSLDAEAGVFCSTFDQTGSRLITGGADKTIKIYGEVA